MANMTIGQASEIATCFFSDMNPTFYGGQGDKPSTFREMIWGCSLTENKDLEISFYYDEFDKMWCHRCEIVDNQSDEVIETLTGYGIDSMFNLVDTIMDLCKEFNIN